MRYTFFFLIFLSIKFNAQIANLDSISSGYFDNYDIIFMGEQHKVSGNEQIEIKLLSNIANSQTSVCLEAGFDLNIPIEKTFSKIDTINYNIFLFSNYGREDALISYLYRKKIKLRAIDVFNSENFSKQEILKIYYSKPIPTNIIDDLMYLNNIGALCFPNRYRNMGLYMKFMDRFNKQRQEHADLLGKDSTAVMEYFECLDAMLHTENDFGKDGPAITNYRESFMFKMLKKEIDNPRNSKVITINGNLHIRLDNTSKWIKDRNFINLASRVKAAYPNKRIASIYLLNSAQDRFFYKEYPDEFNYIADHTLMNKRYIIEINERNLPFKNLTGKYTHIVVY